VKTRAINLAAIAILTLASCAHRPSGTTSLLTAQKTNGEPRPGFYHTSTFERVILTTLQPERDGVRLMGITDGVVTVRLKNGYLISAPAEKNAIFVHASHGYSGYTGIPLVEVDPQAGRVVLQFESRAYYISPAQ
jgi:hypothetical protein